MPEKLLNRCEITVKASMSLIQSLWVSTSSQDSPSSFTPRFSNSGAYLAIIPSSVVHTGVKSPTNQSELATSADRRTLKQNQKDKILSGACLPGWEKMMAYPDPTKS